MILHESNTNHFQALTRALSFSFIAAVVTFLLFVLMHRLIKSDLVNNTVEEVVDLTGVIFESEVEKTITRPIIKPIKPIKQQPRLEPEPIEIVGDDFGVISDYSPVKLTGIGIVTNFNPTVVDRDVRPIVRVPPRYPESAANEGVEGWVQLSFTINAVGEVEDIEVVDSEPKRVFDRAAKRALSAWKYQPKIERGQAIVRTGLSVMLEFNLEQ